MLKLRLWLEYLAQLEGQLTVSYQHTSDTIFHRKVHYSLTRETCAPLGPDTARAIERAGRRRVTTLNTINAMRTLAAFLVKDLNLFGVSIDTPHLALHSCI
jgi:hypothetical protein